MSKLTIYHGNIYNCNLDGKQELVIYICDTNLKNKICIVPVLDVDPSDNNYISIDNLQKVAYYNRMQEIDRNCINSPLYIKGEAQKITYDKYLSISSFVLNMLFFKINLTYYSLMNSRLSQLNDRNYILTEDYYKFITWFDFKTKLEFQNNIRTQPGIILYGIYYAELGQNIGSELSKLRPVLVFKKCVSSKSPNDSSYIVLPISSKQKNSKYKYNVAITINNSRNFIRINDMRRISIKRIKYPLLDKQTNTPIILNNQIIQLLKDMIKKFYID